MDQRETPYLDALRDRARSDPGRFHIPGHKGGRGANEKLKRRTSARNGSAMGSPQGAGCVHGAWLNAGVPPTETCASVVIVAAAPVGGLFARPGVGLYGFDGQQFQLVRPIPWQRIDSLAVQRRRAYGTTRKTKE